MDFELTNEQKDLAKAAREFAEGEFTDRAEECDREESFDEAIFKKAAELGFVGIFIDEKYGGAGLGTLEQCILQEEFSAVDLGMGAAILSACFGAEIIEAFRMEEQKSKSASFNNVTVIYDFKAEVYLIAPLQPPIISQTLNFTLWRPLPRTKTAHKTDSAAR